MLLHFYSLSGVWIHRRARGWGGETVGDPDSACVIDHSVLHSGGVQSLGVYGLHAEPYPNPELLIIVAVPVTPMTDFWHNLRKRGVVIMGGVWAEDIKILSVPTKYSAKRHTPIFTSGVSLFSFVSSLCGGALGSTAPSFCFHLYLRCSLPHYSVFFTPLSPWRSPHDPCSSYWIS